MREEGSGQVRTLGDLIARLPDYGTKPALLVMESGGPVTFSFAQLCASARTIAEELRSHGVAAGEPVGVIAPSGAAWVCTCLGILAAGAAVMPLDVRQSESERKELLASVGCRYLYASDDPRPASLSLRRLVTSTSADADSLQPRESLTTAPVPTPRDTALLMHTSGTTGTPKAVPLTHANVLANIRALEAEGLVGPNDRALLPLPLHHIYPLVVGLLLPLSTGASVVVPGGISGPELAAALRVGDVDILVGVPRLYDSLLRAIADRVTARGRIAGWFFRTALKLSISRVRRNRNGFARVAFSQLRRSVAPALWRLASGGAALDRATEEALLGLGYEVLVGYGLTETAPIVTFNRSGRARIGSAGEPLPGAEVRIANPDPGGVGEIQVRGPNVFAGYLDNTTATSAAFSADGWFRTGDLGRIDPDGYLHIRGRSSETLVLPGGEKLNPEDVERRFASPEIGEIAVLIERGKLVALVVPSASVQREATAEAKEARLRTVLEALSEDLPSYMQPAGFALLEGPLPRTPLGKFRRHLLPALYRAARAEQSRVTPSPILSAADRVLLEDPTGRRVWNWLEARFPNQRLSLELSPQLDLGVDSLEAVAMTMDLEREFGIALEEAALARVRTLRDLVTAAAAAKRMPCTPIAKEIRLAKTGIVSAAIWYVGVTAIRALVRSFYRLRVEGVEYLPRDGPYVLCPNHASYLDGPALAAALPWPVLPRIYWTGAVEVMFSSSARRIFSRLAHVLPIDRMHGSGKGLALSAQALRRNRVVVWFPEGWLTTDETLQPFLPGIGSLVREAQVPIVPVLIAGSFGAWLPQHLLPRPHRVTVRFGPPLDPSRWAAYGAHEGGDESIAAEVKAAVAALGERRDGAVT